MSAFRRAVVLGAATLLAGAAASTIGARAVGRPVTIASAGFWSLHRLGYSEIRLHESRSTGRALARVVYRLPAGTREGPGHWYLVRLHAVVSVRRDSLPGSFEIAADTNGRTAISDTFTVARRRRHLVVSSDFLGLVNGVQRTSGTALTRTVDLRNFLVAGGVRPRRNVLTLRLNATATPIVREVRILPDSGIEVSALGPARVALSLNLREHEVRAGDLFHVDFVLRHLAGRPVPIARVRADFPTDLVSGARGFRSFRWDSTRPLHGTFTLRARRVGRARVGVDAALAGRYPSASAIVYIDPRH